MSVFDEKVNIRRYEDTLPDSKGTGVPRKMTREIWLEECFPEWHCMLNRQILRSVDAGRPQLGV